jgi:cell division protease FtsH
MGRNQKDVSEQTVAVIDAEIRVVIDRNYGRAKQLLADNVDILHAMAEALMQYETIDAKQVDDLMSRQPVRPPEGWTASSTSNIKSDTKPGAPTAEQPAPTHPTPNPNVAPKG